MESVIKWQTGEPKEAGEYLVTTLDGLIDYDFFCKLSDGDLFWVSLNNVSAWCKLSDIEPYKEETK